MMQAKVRWIASRYWLTETRSERPEATIHQPIAPCSPPERQQPDQPRLQPALETARKPEESERKGDEEADAAGEQPVRPLPPEDALELVKGHVLVDLLVLRNLLVLFELFLPFRLVERRDDAVDRLPFGDREPRAGHARGAAHHDQRKQHDQHDIEPAAHKRTIAQLPGRSRNRVGIHGLGKGCQFGVSNRGVVDHSGALYHATRRRAGLRRARGTLKRMRCITSDSARCAAKMSRPLAPG